MHQPPGAHNLAAEHFPYRLVPQTHAEDRDARAEFADDGLADTRFRRGAGSGRDADAFGPEGGESLDGDLIVATHHRLRAEFAEILDEVVGERVVVIEDEEHRRMSAPRLPPRKPPSLLRDDRSRAEIVEVARVRGVTSGVVRVGEVKQDGVQREIVQIREREYGARVEKRATGKIVEVDAVPAVLRIKDIFVAEIDVVKVVRIIQEAVVAEMVAGGELQEVEVVTVGLLPGEEGRV